MWRRLATYLLLGKATKPPFFQFVLHFVSSSFYVLICDCVMFVSVELGRRMISPGPGEGAHPCLGEVISMSWWRCLDVVLSYVALFFCEVKSNLIWVVYQTIHFGFTQLLLCCILFLLGSSSRVQDFLPYLYVLAGAGWLFQVPIFCLPGRAGWPLSTSELSSPILSPFIYTRLMQFFSGHGWTPSTASNLHAGWRGSCYQVSWYRSLVIFLPYRLCSRRVSWYRSS